MIYLIQIEKKYMSNIEPKVAHKVAADDMIQQAISTGKVNKGKALKKAGYSPSTQKTPKLVTESKGFKVYMAEAGITEVSLAKMLAYDLEAKPAERIQELKLATELIGIKENTLNVNLQQGDKDMDTMKALINSMKDEADNGENS